MEMKKLYNVVNALPKRTGGGPSFFDMKAVGAGQAYQRFTSPGRLDCSQLLACT